MPFDDRTFPSAEAALFRRNRRRVAVWLFVVAFMIWGMVLLGGATRLTGSGLSIMEWAPLSGALPPLSQAEWARLFGEYQKIPQYSLLHPGMDLDGFKQIFWLEWTHRAWGRLIGVVFLLPLIWFAVTGAIERRLVPRLLLLFALGGLQGAAGWFMVSSGFFPRKHRRLAVPPGDPPRTRAVPVRRHPLDRAEHGGAGADIRPGGLPPAAAVPARSCHGGAYHRRRRLHRGPACRAEL